MEDDFMSFEFDHGCSLDSSLSKSKDGFLVEYLQCDEMSSPFISSQEEEEKIRVLKQQKLSKKRDEHPHSKMRRTSSNFSQWVPEEDEYTVPTKSFSVRPPPRSSSDSFNPIGEEDDAEEFDDDDIVDSQLVVEQLLESDEDYEEASEIESCSDSDLEDDDDIFDNKPLFLEDEGLVDEDIEETDLFGDNIPKPLPIFPLHPLDQPGPNAQRNNIPLLSPPATVDFNNLLSNNNMIFEAPSDFDRLMKLWKKNKGLYENIFRCNRFYIGSKRLEMFEYTTKLHFELALRMGYRFSGPSNFKKTEKGEIYKKFAVERTLYLALHLLDIFFSTSHNLGEVYNRLICLTILYISSKFEDVNLDIGVFQQMLMREGYEIDLLRKMEFAMLFSLNKFDLVHATIYDFLKLLLLEWKESILKTLPPPPSKKKIRKKMNTVSDVRPRETRGRKKRRNMYSNHPCVVPEIGMIQPPPIYFQGKSQSFYGGNYHQQQQLREEEEEDDDDDDDEDQKRKNRHVECLEMKLESFCLYISNLVVSDLLYLAYPPKSLVDMIFSIGHHLFLHNKLHPLMTQQEGGDKNYKWILMLLKNENRKRGFVSRKFNSSAFDSVAKKISTLL